MSIFQPKAYVETIDSFVERFDGQRRVYSICYCCAAQRAFLISALNIVAQDRVNIPILPQCSYALKQYDVFLKSLFKNKGVISAVCIDRITGRASFFQFPKQSNSLLPTKVFYTSENSLRQTPISQLQGMNEVISKVPSYSRVAALDSPFTAKIYGVIDETTEHRREMPFGGHSVYFGESDILASIEVMERRSCASLDDGQKNKRVFASYNELGPLIAMNPISVGLYSKDFYQKHPDLMFSANKKIHWVEGLSLFSNRKVLVPELLAYLSSDSPQERYIYSTSNGTATGSNLQEAMLFGLLEVIERDAFLVSWYSGEQWKKISLDESPILGKDEKCLIRRMNHFGYRTHFLDITNEFCVPAVAAIAERIDHQYGYLCFGAAAHPLLSGAIRSALSEIASDIDVANKRSRLFEPKIIKMLDDFNYVQTQQDHTDLYAHPASTKLIQERLENTELVVCKEGSNKSRQLLNSTLLLGNYVEKLHHAGYETIAIDETTPAQKYWGLNSVKIIVPGLVPIDFGWDKQRALSNPRVLVRERLQRNISATKKFKPIPHPFP